jgi:hypothetical protein
LSDASKYPTGARPSKCIIINDQGSGKTERRERIGRDIPGANRKESEALEADRHAEGRWVYTQTGFAPKGILIQSHRGLSDEVGAWWMEAWAEALKRFSQEDESQKLQSMEKYRISQIPQNTMIRELIGKYKTCPSGLVWMDGVRRETTCSRRRERERNGGEGIT